MRHALINASVLAIVLGLFSLGCGPGVSHSDLGTIVYEVPSVPGAEEPYRLPELPPLPNGASPKDRMPKSLPVTPANGEDSEPGK